MGLDALVCMCVHAPASVCHKQLPLQCPGFRVLSNAFVDLNGFIYFKLSLVQLDQENYSYIRMKDVGHSVQIFPLTTLKFLHCDVSKAAK